MRWLEHVVGGPEPLATLTTEDLPDEAFELPEQAVGDGDLAARFRRATTLLDDLADEFYDAEMRTAFRRALAAVGTQLLGGVQMCDPAQVAASVCWVVVRANGLMTPAGRATRTTVTSRVGLESFPTTRAKMVSRLLGAPQPSWVSRPYGVTALEPLARTDLLTSRTRKELTSLRDAATAAEAQAVEAQAAARGRDLLIDRGLDLRDLS
jgi:hypothetical protein